MLGLMLTIALLLLVSVGLREGTIDVGVQEGMREIGKRERR